MLKKFISIIAVLAILFNSVLFTSSFLIIISEPTISITADTPNENGEFNATVSIKDNPGLASFTLRLRFDNTKLEVLSRTQGELGGVTLPNVANANTNGAAVFDWVDADGFNDDILLFTVTFKVKDGASGTTNLSLEVGAGGIFDIDMKDAAPDITLVGAEINLGSATDPVKTDAEAVSEAKSALTWDVIRGNNTAQNDIIGNLIDLLPTSGTNDTIITWSEITSTGYVNLTTGEVVRPKYGDGDVTVTLRATISKNSESDTVDFTLILKELPQITAQPEISISTTILDVYDEEFTATVSIKNNPGLASFTLRLRFDNTKLEVISRTQGELGGVTLPNVANANNSGAAVFDWVDADGFTNDISLFTVTFKVKEDALGITNLNLEVGAGGIFDIDMKDVASTINLIGTEVDLEPHPDCYPCYCPECICDCVNKDCHDCGTCEICDPPHICDPCECSECVCDCVNKDCHDCGTCENCDPPHICDPCECLECVCDCTNKTCHDCGTCEVCDPLHICDPCECLDCVCDCVNKDCHDCGTCEVCDPLHICDPCECPECICDCANKTCHDCGTCEVCDPFPTVELSFINDEVKIWADAGIISNDATFDVIKIMPPPLEVTEKVADQISPNAVVIAYYEIRLKDSSGNFITKLSGEIIIATKLPQGYESGKGVNVYMENENGTLVKMESWLENGYIFIKTDWLETY